MSQQPESFSAPVIGFNSVETTPLESLPGHTDTSNRSEYTVTIKGKKCNNILQEHQGDSQDVQNLETDIVVDNACKEDCIKSSCPFAKCSAATSTEELLSYSCVEVQTTPYDTPESESESNDEPIENLSLLTKELLNRTELQERIADNINKAILPTDTSLKDETLNDSVNGEGNTSIMIELNNAIKSIVKATETDPVFEKFLDEIIGPHTETDNTSPDEDIEVAIPKTKCLNGSSREKQLSEIISNNVSSPEPPTILDIKSSNEIGAADVPLKHRLRSSSRQQNTRIEDEQRDSEKEYSALEDQNAAAVLSIINANIINNKSTNDKRMIVDIAKDVRLMDSDNEKKLPAFELPSNEDKQPAKSTNIDNQRGDSNNTTTVQSNNTEPKIKKSSVKRPRPAKSKRELETNANNYTSEQDIMTMPTLIVCSKEEISNIVLATSTSYPPTRPITSITNSRFIPIVPKDPTIGKDFVETLYLKTVNVPQKLPLAVPNIPDDSKNVISPSTLQTRQKRKTNKINNKRKTITVQNSTSGLTIGNSIVNSVIPSTNKFGIGESITLYSNENSSRTLLDGSNMPTINIDDNVSLSGTGLSPYVKFNCSKGNQNQSLSDIDLTPIIQAPKVTAPLEINVLDDQGSSTSKNIDRDVINKRTPRSLLKSRSKNHRLSLSTPRRKSSSHVRALDFNTPTKVAAMSNRSMSENENTHFSPRSSKHVKSVRRTSLFKSPPFTNTTMSAHKIKRTSPKICRPLKPPVATRSPMPKLIGGWEKYNGVGVIIDDVSPQKNLVTVSFPEDTTQIKPSKIIKDTWDADLRKSLQVIVEDECQTTKTEQTKDKTVASRKDKCNTRILKGRKRGNSTSKDAVDAKVDHVYEEQVTTESTLVENPSNALLMKKNLPDAQHVNHVDNDNAQKDTSQPCIVESQNIPEEKNTNKLSLETNQQDATTIATITNDSSALVKKTVKKYAQLKTLKTNLNKCNVERKDTAGSNLTSTDIVQYTEFAKSSVDITRHMLQLMPELVNLEETPRKFETLPGVPPTPRLLSPSSNATPFVKSNEDSSKLRSFINTPEFPTTPCIALTPKLSEETSTNDTKKDAFNTCSPYYKPTSEQNENSEKLSKSKSSNNLQNSSTLSPHSLKLCIPQNIINSTNTYQACVSAKLEITQFEVIKENLPKEDAVKELKISANSRDSTRYVKLKSDRVKDGIVEHTCAITDNDKSLIHKEESNDSDTSTSSNSSSTSSSSSSSSTSSSSSPSFVSSNKSITKNLPEKSPPSKKCNRISNQIYTDTSNDSTRKGTHVLETVIPDNNSELQVNKVTDTPCTDHTEEEIIALRKCESSPVKVFSIAKTDEELKIGTIETPAKDETLLNEADISETPNSSKTGVESLTNLSSKIAAFISSEDRKLSKSSQDLFVENSTKKLKQKPRIMSMQRTKLNSSITLKKPTKNLKRSTSLTTDEKLAVQLEAKRQRMIAKFRESPKSNLTRGKSQRGRVILKGKGNANPRKKNTQCKYGQVNGDQFGEKRKKRKTVNVKESNNNNKKEMIVEHLPANSLAKIEKCSSETTEVQSIVQCSVASSSVVCQNKTSRNEEIVRVETSTLKTIKYADVEAKNESKKVIYALVEDVANDVEIAASREKSSDAFDTENKICNSSTAEKNEIATKLEAAANLETKCAAIGAEDNNTHDSGEYSLDVRKSGNDEMISEITSQDSKSDAIKNEHNYNEKNVRKIIEYSNQSNKINILKSKVDQVKRDLFSDEENDKTSNSIKSSTNQEVNDIVQILQVPDTVKSSTENIDPENPKNLSRVLQSLQLVPTCKNDHMGVPEQGQENDCKTNLDVTSVPNSVEYHFLYDDNAPLKKRRRRCSSHELEFQINIVLNDQGYDECVKVMTATDYEEIFNLPPKSRKRFPNRKSPVKNENVCESLDKVFFSPLTIKNIHDKPLATSSPFDKPLTYKVKKGTVKTVAINEKNNEVQYDSKKKPKVDKTTREIDKDNSTGKISKRKLSEMKDSKQVEKRQYTTDPQTLLSNLDLDKFLTSVHGPA